MPARKGTARKAVDNAKAAAEQLPPKEKAKAKRATAAATASKLPPSRGPRNSPNSRQKIWEPSTRDLEIYARLASGESTRQVAAQFELAQSRIDQIGKNIDAWLAPQWMDSIREIKARQTESLQHIFREAMAAWERSKQDAESVTVKNGKDGLETSKTAKGQVGDSRYLAEARAALADIRKIWGADAPLQVEVDQMDRVAGLSRNEAIQQQMDKMRAAMLEPNEN